MTGLGSPYVSLTVTRQMLWEPNKNSKLEIMAIDNSIPHPPPPSTSLLIVDKEITLTPAWHVLHHDAETGVLTLLKNMNDYHGKKIALTSVKRKNSIQSSLRKWWKHTPNYFTTVFWLNSLLYGRWAFWTWFLKWKSCKEGVSYLLGRNNVISTGSLTNTWNHQAAGVEFYRSHIFEKLC